MRPALAIMGLFIACLLADPVINFIAEAFFAMRGDISAGSGAMSVVANFTTFMWWLAAFALTLLPILYMIFFLPQTLPDEILRWLGGGLHSLGDSRAVTAAQAGISGIYAATTTGRGATGGAPFRIQRQGANSGGDGQNSGNGGGSGGRDQALVGGQGVAGGGSSSWPAGKKGKS